MSVPTFLREHQFYSGRGKIDNNIFQIQYWTRRMQRHLDVDNIIMRLKRVESSLRDDFPLKEEEIQNLSHLTRAMLLTQPMLLELDPPVIVCGDIHGQFRDLLNIFDKMGEPGERSYLFLGDYVDRGKKSLECICLLMAYKLKYPLNFFLLRGNHECSELNKIYGFYDECKRKFGIRLWKTITHVFDFLPIAAVIGGRVFCVHGGLSPHLKRLEALNLIKRPISNSGNKLISDLLWSDPSTKVEYWDANFERGISCVYGRKVIDEFVEQYDFDFVCRSHQVVEEGYQFFNERKLLTVFSAPNYCGEFENLGGVLKISKQMVCHIEVFKGTAIKAPLNRRSSTPMIGQNRRRSIDELQEGTAETGLKVKKATMSEFRPTNSLKENIRPFLTEIKNHRSQ